MLTAIKARGTRVFQRGKELRQDPIRLPVCEHSVDSCFAVTPDSFGGVEVSAGWEHADLFGPLVSPAYRGQKLGTVLLEASIERSFRYLVNEDAGCFDVTQFLGIVQPSKAPFHSHSYDEVGYVLAGEGVAHVGGRSTPIRAGSCFHLPPDEVHCIENSGTETMHILGVFHPSGSPANRAYPDNK